MEATARNDHEYSYFLGTLWSFVKGKQQASKQKSNRKHPLFHSGNLLQRLTSLHPPVTP
jgi:hypothetical protein